jgi:hypothetical protein
MAAPTRRKHGHVAGLRRRPFNPTMVDKPSGLIEEPDEDEVPAESVEAVDVGVADAADVAEDAEDDVPAEINQPAAAEVGQEQPTEPENVAEPEPVATETVEAEPAEAVGAEAQPEAVEEETAEEDAAEAQPEAVEEETAEEDAAEPVEAVTDAEHLSEANEESTEGDPESAEVAEYDEYEEQSAEVTEDDEEGAEAAEHDEDSAEADPHADLFAWLAGDGESLADLLGTAKPPEPYTPVPLPVPFPAPRPLARPPRLDRQSFRRATDTRPTAAPLTPPPSSPGRPGVAAPPPRPAPVNVRPKPKHRRRTAVLIAAVIVAMAVVAGVLALVIPGSSNDNGTTGQGNSTSPIPPPVQTAEPVVWVKQNLPSSAAIIAPAALVPSLQAAGYTTVYADDALKGLTLADVKYIVGEPAVAPGAGDLEKFVNATAPLAYFGTGSTQTMVGEVFGGGTAAMAKAMVADTKLRVQEGSALLKNPNVHTDVAMRKVLANGLLDARAGALIVSLAVGRQVTVTNPIRSAPEAAAGLPYRIFTVSIPDTVFLDNSLRRASPKYKPASVVVLGPIERRLIWTPAVAPDKPFR